MDNQEQKELNKEIAIFTDIVQKDPSKLGHGSQSLLAVVQKRFSHISKISQASRLESVCSFYNELDTVAESIIKA